jgi:hypothetical protein
LRAYVEEDRSLDAITRLGFDEESVQRIMGLVDRSEYKRRQAPPGVKITPRAFGRDRRIPITNQYHGAPPVAASDERDERASGGRRAPAGRPVARAAGRG